MDEYINRKTLRDELASLSVTVTGLRAGKGVLNECMEQYRESVLRVVDEQATADVSPVRHGWFNQVDDIMPECEKIVKATGFDLDNGFLEYGTKEVKK